jgi:hypothetical protein
MITPNIQVHFNKIQKCIQSCKTYEQLESCQNMVDTFMNKFAEHKLVIISLLNLLMRKSLSLDKINLGIN